MNPIIIMGSDALQREDGGAVVNSVQQIGAKLRQSSGAPKSWPILNVMNRVASQVAALDLGYKPGVSEVRQAKPKVLWMPGAAYTEKQATYVNMEGRAQQTYPALVSPGEARVDWKIIRVLSEVLDEKLPYDNLNELRARMAEVAPNLVRYGSVEQ